MDALNTKFEQLLQESIHNDDLPLVYAKFEQSLPSQSIIIDVGSGTGRDSLYFTRKGYKVISFDASESLVEFSKLFLEDVRLETFESFNIDTLVDGIWACASLLHVERNDILRIMQKYVNFLKPHGVFYMSFKACDYDYIKDGRQFTCFTLNSMNEMINHLHDVKVVEIFETQDARQDRSESWINVILQRI
jgi:SAM-dependent methyltransferase